ncbi:MAG: hypothetical protein ACLFVP_01555 [Candidatus Bathyarchaeia archaeon]
MIVVKDVTLENIDDVFRVCSKSKINDPVQEKGIALKREWMEKMIEEYGAVSKLAYFRGSPSAQILFYPEDALPYLAYPRESVLRIECIYNSNTEARGKGVATSLLDSLLEEARKGLLECMRGAVPRFIVADAFETGEGISMEDFYLAKDFRKGSEELYKEMKSKIPPREEG